MCGFSVSYNIETIFILVRKILTDWYESSVEFRTKNSHILCVILSHSFVGMKHSVSVSMVESHK